MRPSICLSIIPLPMYSVCAQHLWNDIQRNLVWGSIVIKRDRAREKGREREMGVSETEE